MTDHDDQEEGLTTKNDWPRYDCTILTYENASLCNFWHTWWCLGGKFPLFCSLRTHYETCSLLKICVCTHLLTHESMIMCSFEHSFPLVHPMWGVSTKLYQLRDVTTCKFSLKRRISALVWLAWTPPCATFEICGHVWAESFHCFTHCERTMRYVHWKTTCVYITFRLTKTCICVTINTTLCFPPTFPSIYLNSHTTTWLFLLTNPFQYPTINIRHHVWVHWFDWCVGLLDLLNVKRHPSKQIVWLTRSCVCANFHIGGRVCM